MKKYFLSKKFIALMLAGTMALGIPVTAYATSSTKEQLEQAQKDRENSQSQLDQTNTNIDNMTDKQNKLQSELDGLNQALTEVSLHLSEIEERMAAKQAEIESTQEALKQAQDTADLQYASMKKRIQFMYENGNFGYLEMLLTVGNVSDMINYMDYVEALSAYDRKMLVQYRETCADIAQKEALLQQEQEELAAAKVEQEAEQSRVSGLVSTTAGNIADYADQIESAEKRADALEAKIKEQDQDIAALTKKYEEELRQSQLAKQSAKRDISQVTFADGDRYLLANLIYCEAGGEPYAGQVAVGAVVINRLLSSRFPDTITGVIYQNRQFSPVSDGHLALALAANKATAACYQAADEAMAGVSNVGDCYFFRTPIPGLTGIAIGGHIFY